MVDKSKDLVVSLGPLKHEGVTKDTNGRSIIRIFSTMTFNDIHSGKIWDIEVETFVIAAASGELEPGQFSEADAYARLDKVVPGNAELERFEVKALFDADPGQVKVLSRDDAAALISGIVHLYPLSTIQSDENVQLTIFGLRSSSGSDLILFHQRADAEKELKILREKRLAANVGSIRPRRGGRPH